MTHPLFFRPLFLSLIHISGKPILMRTIERFHEYDPALNIILVLPESQQAYWHQLCEEHHFSIKHQIANGGDTRFQSSKNGLALIPDDEDGVVGIHDGVRPFVSKEVIAVSYTHLDVYKRQIQWSDLPDVAYRYLQE